MWGEGKSEGWREEVKREDWPQWHLYRIWVLKEKSPCIGYCPIKQLLTVVSLCRVASGRAPLQVPAVQGEPRRRTVGGQLGQRLTTNKIGTSCLGHHSSLCWVSIWRILLLRFSIQLAQVGWCGPSTCKSGRGTSSKRWLSEFSGDLKARVSNRKAFGGSLEDGLRGESERDFEKKNIGHRKQKTGTNIRKVSMPEGIGSKNLLTFFFFLDQLSEVQQTNYRR